MVSNTLKNQKSFTIKGRIPDKFNNQIHYIVTEDLELHQVVSSMTWRGYLYLPDKNGSYTITAEENYEEFSTLEKAQIYIKIKKAEKRLS